MPKYTKEGMMIKMKAIEIENHEFVDDIMFRHNNYKTPQNLDFDLETRKCNKQ